MLGPIRQDVKGVLQKRKRRTIVVVVVVAATAFYHPGRTASRH
jgi:hypothetical protein